MPHRNAPGVKTKKCRFRNRFCVCFQCQSMLDFTPMEDAPLGFQNVTTRLPAIGKTMSTLAGLLVFFSTTAYGQVVLDDFSANNESNYKFVPVLNSPSDGWTVTAGELRPSIDGVASATWLWNGDEKLSAAGDSVSISLS